MSEESDFGTIETGYAEIEENSAIEIDDTPVEVGGPEGLEGAPRIDVEPSRDETVVTPEDLATNEQVQTEEEAVPKKADDPKITKKDERWVLAELQEGQQNRGSEVRVRVNSIKATFPVGRPVMVAKYFVLALRNAYMENYATMTNPKTGKSEKKFRGIPYNVIVEDLPEEYQTKLGAWRYLDEHKNIPNGMSNI